MKRKSTTTTRGVLFAFATINAFFVLQIYGSASKPSFFPLGEYVLYASTRDSVPINGFFLCSCTMSRVRSMGTHRCTHFKTKRKTFLSLTSSLIWIMNCLCLYFTVCQSMVSANSIMAGAGGMANMASSSSTSSI